jgi:Fe-S cluster biogenesis protein NfuA
MFIQTEQTPNPATLKFIPGRAVGGEKTADYVSAEAAAESPLARRLFAVEGVTGVFLGADFVTVAKRDDKEWQVIKPEVLGAIMDHFTSGEPVFTGAGPAATDKAEGEDDEIAAQIRELIDTRVRPAVAMDGGDITFREFRDGVVYLRMQGACSGCPSSTATLKHGIENMLRYYVPEVVSVEPVEA